MVSAIEGAIILCRAYRDDGPWDDVLAEIMPLLGSAVGVTMARRPGRIAW